MAKKSWPINHQISPSGSIWRGRKNQAGFGKDVDVREPDGAAWRHGMKVSEFGLAVADNG